MMGLKLIYVTKRGHLGTQYGVLYTALFIHYKKISPVNWNHEMSVKRRKRDASKQRKNRIKAG